MPTPPAGRVRGRRWRPVRTCLISFIHAVAATKRLLLGLHQHATPDVRAEAARVFAARIMRECDGDTTARTSSTGW